MRKVAKEEGEYENASYHHGAENGKTEEAHLESGVLYQPLVTEAGKGNAGESSPVPLCKGSSEAANELCARDAFLGIHIHIHVNLGHVWHAIKHWITTTPETDRLRTEVEDPEPSFMNGAAQDADDWGFDDIEFDW